ncbi:hypothetical protein RFI_18370 [Reticulomyxa filosa]|uniref:Uncharacterized protein n=1 Tax=Reticulomyxa filosa TaxID=46433 RepID=X6N0Q4_RETFI|nr:hypothetical protein RFI_18370 [Reticulomyxa filosa]|eukprot:ETO18877.1 hypothetical protein RFI_18370 [Reticulomyxa filosa]
MPKVSSRGKISEDDDDDIKEDNEQDPQLQLQLTKRSETNDIVEVEEEKTHANKLPRIGSAPRVFARKSDKLRLSKTPIEDVKEMDETKEQMATIIDYNTLQMDTRQQCKCGHVISDAEVMASWPEDFISTNIECKVCKLNSLIPKIHIKCFATEMALHKASYQQKTLDFYVTYLSPSYLRRSIETITTKYRQCLEDCESFRKHRPDEYWNLLWYFSQRNLDITWLLENFETKLRIDQILDPQFTQFPENNEVCATFSFMQIF